MRFMHFKFLIFHSICLSICVGELSLEIEKEKNALLKWKNVHVNHSYLIGDQVWKFLMLENFLPSCYEHVKQGYEIEL